MVYVQRIILNAIGYVQAGFTEPTTSEEMRQQPSRLIINEELAAGLEGLCVGDSLLVLFFLDHAHGYELRRHPRDDDGRPKRGVFALRTQYRPNPIGATIARIDAIDGNVVHVTGLDALDGSPIIDIKPYVPEFDAPGLAEQDGVVG